MVKKVYLAHTVGSQATVKNDVIQMVYLLALKRVDNIPQRVAVTPGDPQPSWDSEHF